MTKKLFFILISLFYAGHYLQAASCLAPQVIEPLDIKIPCVLVDGQAFSTSLNNKNNELLWQWDGNISSTTCTNEQNVCVTLDKGNLNFPALILNDQDYTATLNLAPEVGEFTWRYHQHQIKATENMDVFPESSKQALRDFIKNAIATNQIPGAIIGIASGNKTILLEAFGKSNVEQNKKLTVDQLFHIGSTHKMMTSFLISTLVDKGILQWDTKAQAIYPQFTLSNSEYASQITIRQLLSMTSGLPKDIDDVFDNPTRFILEGLTDFDFIGPPEQQYSYSNLSISMAGYLAVLAKAKADNGVITETDLNNLHAGYERLLRETVLDPIGMKNSYLYIDDARATGKMANSHHLNNGTFVVSESVDTRIDNIAPAGGLKSTAGDMLRYIITEMQQGLSPDGVQVAESNHIAERQKLSTGVAGEEEYGIAVEIKSFNNGLTYIGHTGSFDNFNSIIGFFPSKKIAFVLLTNGDSPAALDLTSTGIEEKMLELLE